MHHEWVTPQQPVSLSVVWPGLDDTPVQLVNQMLTQGAAATSAGKMEETIVAFGYVAPPVILGTQEEQMLAATALGAATVRPLFRMAITRTRLSELIKLLEDAAEKWDSAGEVGGAQ